MPRIRAGELRSRLVLQAKTEAGDGQGGTTKTWAAVATVWAKKVPADMSGDTTEADQTVSRRRHVVTIRRRAGVTSAMRLLDGTQPLEITSVVPSDDFLDGLTIECREVPS
jgi:SPP1 family predicted phage head-tail adaptor